MIWINYLNKKIIVFSVSMFNCTNGFQEFHKLCKSFVVDNFFVSLTEQFDGWNDEILIFSSSLTVEPILAMRIDSLSLYFSPNPRLKPIVRSDRIMERRIQPKHP